MEKPLAQTLCTRENCIVAEVEDEDMECEDGASPALLGGFIVPAFAGDEVDLDEKMGTLRHLNHGDEIDIHASKKSISNSDK